MSLKVGDWVRSNSAGIWQIYRILEYKCLDPVTGKEHSKTTIFSKRFLSNKFKRSFKEECCAPSFVFPLELDEASELESFIGQNEKLYQKFLDYKPKNIDCIFNARVGIPETGNMESIVEKLSYSKVIRDLDINEYLENIGFDTKKFPSWTVQFVSENFSVEYGFLVFKFYRVLEQ